jgi:hypothetical protein
VASFTIYREAERAVDLLSDRGFPVERIAIVGRDLQLVEQVTGRMGYGQAALRGALQGAVLGLLFGWLFGLFNWIDPVVASFSLAFYGLVFGAVVGALLGLLTHAMTGGRRDFASVSGMQASRYDVLPRRVEISAKPGGAQQVQPGGGDQTGGGDEGGGFEIPTGGS